MDSNTHRDAAEQISRAMFGRQRRRKRRMAQRISRFVSNRCTTGLRQNRKRAGQEAVSARRQLDVEAELHDMASAQCGILQPAVRATRSAVDVQVVVGFRRHVGEVAPCRTTVLTLSMSAAIVTHIWTPPKQAQCATDLHEEPHRHPPRVTLQLTTGRRMQPPNARLHARILPRSAWTFPMSGYTSRSYDFLDVDVDPKRNSTTSPSAIT